MGVKTPPAVSWHRALIAVLTGALAAWVAFVSTFLLFRGVMGDDPATSLNDIGDAIGFFAVFGLPFAWATALLLGWPTALIAIRRGWRSLTSAMLAGAAAASLPGALFLAWRLFDGIRSRGAGNTFSYGGAEGNLWQDNWPTALGWWQEAEQIAVLMLLGALAGLVARKVMFGRTPDLAAG